MSREKKIVVHHPGSWRMYRADRELLAALRLGDVIPSAGDDWCDDPVADHLYSHSDAPADIIAVSSPHEGEWAELSEIIARAERKELRQELLAWEGASCILSASKGLSRGRE